MRDDKGRFEPGSSGNPAGRPSGSSNKAKEWQDEFFDGDRDQAKEDWKKLSPGQRWQIRAKYWDFQFPKLRSEHVDLSLDSMSDQLAGKIIAEVLTKTITDEVKYKSPDGGGKDSPGDTA